MCTRCIPPAATDPSLSRRKFCQGTAAIGTLAAAVLIARPVAAAEGLVEPKLRLRGPSTPDTKRVALTLDACPGGFDHRIATYLADNGVPATIFLTSAWIRRNPAGLAFLLDHRDLFAFENHGARHIPPVLGERSIYGLRAAGTLDAIRREVETGAADIREATGAQTRWYRGATGLYSPAAIEAIEAMGFGIGGYSLNADMGASLPAATVASRVGAARDGDVIVCHLTQPKRPSGLGIVAGVKALRLQGTVFTHLDTPTV